MSCKPDEHSPSPGVPASPTPPSAPPNVKVEQISIMIKGWDGTELYFKVKPTTRMGKVKGAYAARVGDTDPTALRFMYEGVRVQNQTPEELELEDGGVIEVHIEQIGGFRCISKEGR